MAPYKTETFPLLPHFSFFYSLIFFFSGFLFLAATALDFSYTNFDTDPGCNSGETTRCIAYQSDTYYDAGALHITKDNTYHSVGRAVYKENLPLWDRESRNLTDFTTHFSFIIEAAIQNQSGDGFSFFLSAPPSVIPPGSDGSYLGLFNGLDQNASIQTVAVEFDTYYNVEWDPSSDHVGININNIRSAATLNWNSSLKAGKVSNAWISYSGSTQVLRVILTYANTSIYAGNSSLSYVVDLRQFLPEEVVFGFSGSTGGGTENHRILSWVFNSTLDRKPTLDEGRKKSDLGLVVGLVSGGVAALVLISSLFFFALWWRRRWIKKEDKDHDPQAIDDEFTVERGPRRFPYSQLARATNNFAEDRKLGQGGFGAVYRGFLSDLNQEVAIKKISRDAKQGKKEYISEVKTISRLRHRNLVQLVGWCHESWDLMLVYEFMPNRSLDTHLYNGSASPLPWPVRYKIAIDLAGALFYLHEEGEQCVVHRDIKPSNVMLDSAFNVKLGDFGLARLIDRDRGPQTTDVAGTMSYMAPECFVTCKANKESDVYSFGIVALEIACGRRPMDFREEESQMRLVDWVWELYGSKKLMEAADARLKTEFNEEQMERLMVVGLWCAQPDCGLRPAMKQVINVLTFESSLPELPPDMPAMFFAPTRDMGGLRYTSSGGASWGGNPMTTSSSDTNASISSMTPGSSPSVALLASERSESHSGVQLVKREI